MLHYAPADVERLTPEPGKPGDERHPWEIDRARILHSAAFRRLQRKTQVFAPGEGDFFRTRLTHSIEVSQIAKGIALRVGADPTLCEAASLAHDIGHPPFGHAGESVLHHCMAGSGGFEGNAQNLRVVATLEVKTVDYLGLNLTRATIDAMLKYKRSYSEALVSGDAKFFYDDDLPLVEWACQRCRDDRTSFECQIMDWADDVAYSIHDIEDGMWAGLVTPDRLRQTRVEADPGVAAAVLAELEQILAVEGGRPRKAATKTWSSNAIYEMVHAASPEVAPDQGRGPRYRLQLRVEPRVRAKSRVLKALADELVLRHERISSTQDRADLILSSLFRAFTAHPELISEDFLGPDPARATCDYISGMTDDYAEQAYQRLVAEDVLSGPDAGA
ncbi:MAG TPA: dNTP triphosphohydrolase [Chloroflexota bacterium]|nr:dNTP triphosphohydrolase [Chloroflexota bacterium]